MASERLQEYLVHSPWQILNGPFGWKLLRNRGRTRALVAKQLTKSGRRRLASFARGRPLRRAAAKVDYAISMTSWKPRLGDLPLVLLDLLEQSVRPETIIVWLTEEDLELFEPVLRQKFSSEGVDFRVCDNLGPHKKWLPILESGREKPFVIADDDVFYPRRWLEMLVNEDRPDAYSGVRCHRMTFSTGGEIRPYSEWLHDIGEGQSPSPDIFVTGIGGAVVHPARITPEYRDRDQIKRLCARNDDIWLKAAHLAAGFPSHKISLCFPCLEIPGTQASALFAGNVDRGENDTQMEVVRRAYGTWTSVRA